MGVDSNICATNPESVDVSNTKVRRASAGDIKAIMDVACSVGNSNKVHSKGFLMDDYVKDYDYLTQKFTGLISELNHFYVIEENSILGFLIAYKKEEWLRYNPKWLEDILWHPMFDMKNTDEFILIDKTAIMSNITGRGLGSILYKTLFEDMRQYGISNIFAETIISPTPNFASLEFRIKQKYNLAGVRFESYKDMSYTDLVYHKTI